MHKKLKALIGVAIVVLLAGCGIDKGKDFVGHWVEVNSQDKTPATLDISYEEGLYHIDQYMRFFGKDINSKLIGKVESSTILSVQGGLIPLTMRLQNSRLFFNGRELVKSP